MGVTLITADGKTVNFLNGSSSKSINQHVVAGYEVESASYAPERGRFVAGGRSDMWVHLYDFETGQEVECSKGHHGPVHCVRFAPRGGDVCVWVGGRNFTHLADGVCGDGVPVNGAVGNGGGMPAAVPAAS